MPGPGPDAEDQCDDCCEEGDKDVEDADCCLLLDVLVLLILVEGLVPVVSDSKDGESKESEAENGDFN